MNKTKQFSFVLLMFFAFAPTYLATSAFAQIGGDPNSEECDSNPACDPASGTCCEQECDPNPACVGGPNTLPCCEDPANGSGDPNGGSSDPNPACGPASGTCSEDPALGGDVTLNPDMPDPISGKEDRVRPKKSGEMKLHAPSSGKPDRTLPRKSGQMKLYGTSDPRQQPKPSSRTRSGEGSAVRLPGVGRTQLDDAAEEQRAMCLDLMQSLRRRLSRFLEEAGQDMIEQFTQELRNETGSPLPLRCQDGFGFACSENRPGYWVDPQTGRRSEILHLGKWGIAVHHRYHEVYTALGDAGCLGR